MLTIAYRLFTVVPLLLMIFLAACTNTPLQVLPSGEQTLSGILRPAELSAVRRGSHLLEQDGVNVYYIESTLVNLREYQGKRVTLRGFITYNTNPEDLPVFSATSVVDVEDTMKEHVLQKVNVRLSTPVHWILKENGGRYDFFLDELTSDPIFSVWEEGTELPDGGVPIVVDATRATRLIDDLSGTQIVAVKRPASILQLRFSPGTRLTGQRLQEDFIEVLHSIDLLTEQSSSLQFSGTGALGLPCGGSAGILCSPDSFCDIQDVIENIGRCRKL